jgi:copper chaperone CopZ
MIAAACMSASSLIVVCNALRLTRFEKKEKVEEKENLEMKKVLKIEGMMCKHCVAHVTKALAGVDGVESVEVSLEKGEAVVLLNKPVADEALIAPVVDGGYEVKSIC